MAGAGPGGYEALLTIAIAPNADSATTIAMIENGKDFAARVNDQIKRLTNGIFVVAKASGAREATFHDVPQPAWFVKSVNAKIKSLQDDFQKEMATKNRLDEEARKTKKTTCQCTVLTASAMVLVCVGRVYYASVGGVLIPWCSVAKEWKPSWPPSGSTAARRC